MNSMTSYEKEDMAGKMNGYEEDSDEFDDIMWKGRYGRKKCMDAKKILMNSMASFEQKDMAGKNELLGELNPRTIC